MPPFSSRQEITTPSPALLFLKPWQAISSIYQGCRKHDVRPERTPNSFANKRSVQPFSPLILSFLGRLQVSRSLIPTLQTFGVLSKRGRFPPPFCVSPLTCIAPSLSGGDRKVELPLFRVQISPYTPPIQTLNLEADDLVPPAPPCPVLSAFNHTLFTKTLFFRHSPGGRQSRSLFSDRRTFADNPTIAEPPSFSSLRPRISPLDVSFRFPTLRGFRAVVGWPSYFSILCHGPRYHRFPHDPPPPRYVSSLAVQSSFF